MNKMSIGLVISGLATTVPVVYAARAVLHQPHEENKNTINEPELHKR